MYMNSNYHLINFQISFQQTFNYEYNYCTDLFLVDFNNISDVYENKQYFSNIQNFDLSIKFKVSTKCAYSLHNLFIISLISYFYSKLDLLQYETRYWSMPRFLYFRLRWLHGKIRKWRYKNSLWWYLVWFTDIN